MKSVTDKELEEWLVSWVANESKLKKEDVKLDEPFVNFGLGSRQAVILSSELEEWLNIELDASISWEFPTIKELANHLATLKK